MTAIATMIIDNASGRYGCLDESYRHVLVAEITTFRSHAWSCFMCAESRVFGGLRSRTGLCCLWVCGAPGTPSHKHDRA